jgi:hypothetical protein
MTLEAGEERPDVPGPVSIVIPYFSIVSPPLLEYNTNVSGGSTPPSRKMMP